MMATDHQPPMFYPPSLEFLLRRSLVVGSRPTVPPICSCCGELVDDHREPGTNAFVGCLELAHRRAAARDRSAS